MFNKMWPLAKSSSSQASGMHRTKENLSEELHAEVRSAAPGARLSNSLRISLERLEKSERAKVVSTTKADLCSPLFLACKKGNLEIVQYLIETCGADVEQRGIYEVLDEKASHRVTPLWCASVSGRLSVVKCLVKHGASVNAVSDTGSSPVRSACFMTHLEIVQYLVEEAGADIQLPNFNGGTCLINSVQSPPLCEYLLVHGAAVNAMDIQLKSALHYAIQEHRFETTKLLLKFGADPFQINRYGDDALQTAALKGATMIFNYLVANVEGYSAERRAEMLELMGSTFIDEHHDIQMALTYWRESIDLREREGIHKPRLGYSPLYSIHPTNLEGTNVLQVDEFRTRQELEIISADVELMRINSLLMAERILGNHHKDVIFRIMYRGAAYADLQLYPLCISLWIYALQLRIGKDSILYGDSCFTALALIRLYLDLDRNREHYIRYAHFAMDSNPLTFNVLMRTFVLLIDQIPESSRLVKLRPQFKRQLESFDRCVRCCTHLLYLLRKVTKTAEEWYQLKLATARLVACDPRMCTSGDTILHMAVSKNNVVRSNFFMEDRQVSVFPNFEVTQFLILCGANVNALNDARSTPLHILVSHEDYDNKIVEYLIQAGAHVDQLDKWSKSPLTQLIATPYPGFRPLSHISLKCLCARVIARSRVPFTSTDLPRELAQFLFLHLPPIQESSGGESSDGVVRVLRVPRLPA